MVQRDKKIDFLKGLGIISVILGHTIQRWPISTFISTFHMPLFFFVGGCFYQYMSSKDLIKKSLRALIFPYILLSGLLLIINLLNREHINWYDELIKILWADGYINKPLIGGGLPYVGIRWFFPALFWCRVIYNCISQLRHVAIGAVLISVGSYIIGHYIINIPFGICEGGQAVIFYMVGHKFYINKAIYYRNIGYMLLMGIAWCGSFLFHGMSLADFSYGCYPVNVIGAIGAVVYLYKITDILMKSSIAMIWNWCILFYGKNSLYILCFHILIGGFVINDSIYMRFVIQFVGCGILTLLYCTLKDNLIKKLINCLYER